MSTSDNYSVKLQKIVKDLIEQAKKADAHLHEIKGSISKIDREAARAGLSQAKSAGLNEINRLKGRIQSHLQQLQDELKDRSEKLKAESGKVRSKAQATLKTVKTQIQTIAEAERSKRRGRSRSE